ncbi:MAG TPA: YraN family protein [Roseomonas sp.]|jgi:putative endonuclease
MADLGLFRHRHRMITPDPKPARRRRGSLASARGADAEATAAALLAREGWALLARRVRTPAGEIDLVAERDGLLVFVEVKARPSFQDAAFALGVRQRARLLAAAEIWLARNAGHGAAGMRFDVILVAADGSARRIADAFRLGD